ncbi:MAG: hypothetical protein V1744_00020 [Candidatus Altiarchaeota archaeon]
MDKLSKWFLGTLIILLLTLGTVQGAKIGIIVDYPDGSTHIECIEASNLTDGYNVANKMAPDITWGGPHPLYGHSLCKINGGGTEPNAGGCEWGSEYWAYWVIKEGSYSWLSIPVGHDGGEECWNRDPGGWVGHYCAVDGDVIGYVYGEYDPVTYAAPKMRTKETFYELCLPEGDSGKAKRIPRVMKVVMSPENPVGGDVVSVLVTDNKTEKPVYGISVEAFKGGGVPGLIPSIYSGVSDKEGMASFKLGEIGGYTLRLSGMQYPQEQFTINVTAPTTTTTTTTTTTSTTTTTYTPPPHFLESIQTTTTTETTTTTIDEPKIIGDASAQQQKGGGLLTWLLELIGL